MRAAMLGPLMLGVALPAALRHGRLPQWRHDYARADDVLAPRGDRRPLAGAVCDLGSHARLAQRCSLREASTGDTEMGRRGPAAPMSDGAEAGNGYAEQARRFAELHAGGDA